ncbi:MAG TPA: aminoglycoside phosphotransferase family protein, partial [Anaerolineaceae bacterium]|nr:aminoglycoside phosphotransferase family protein [Anaerolineaceae bacterium]
KTPVTLAQAEQIAAHHFGAQCCLANFEELTDGYFNACYRIDLSDGARCVLKVAPPDGVRILRYERDILRAEVETLRLVRARTTAPVPQVLAHDTSRQVLANDYFLMEFLPGVPLHKARPSLPPEAQAQIDRQLGGYLRQINEICGPCFGYFAKPQPQGVEWAQTFARMLGSVLEDGAAIGVVLPWPYEQFAALPRLGFAALAEITQPRLVHWDLWDGNVFVDPENAQVTGLFDFERALWGDPLMETNFGYMAAEGSPFMQGYGMAMLDTPNKRLRRRLYAIYLYLIMIIECSYRNYENDQQEKWSRAQLVRELEGLVDLD